MTTPPPVVTSAPSQRIVCKVCDVGSLEYASLSRLSGPAVVVGWILVGAIALAIVGLAASDILDAAARQRLQQEAKTTLPGFTAATPSWQFIVGRYLLLFMFGLPGYLLTMKRDVLQCNHCCAVIAAS